jgi:hypothetical protein
MGDQKPSSNTAMNRSQEGVAGTARTAATTPPAASHGNQIEEQKPDEKDSRRRPETDQPLVGGVHGQQNPQLKR